MIRSTAAHKTPVFEIISVFVIIVTVFAMALTDALIKLVSSDMSLWQVYVLRSLMVLPALALIRRGRLRPEHAGWVYLRSLLLTAMYLAIYAAIPVLSLSVLAASLYTGPLFITALSALVLNRKISATQWGAILLGLIGVGLVLQPNAEAFSWYSLVPLAAALLYALAATITSAKCENEHPVVLGFALNITLMVFGSLASLAILWIPGTHLPDYPFLFGRWSELSAQHLSFVVVLAGLFLGVSVGLARAYQSKQPEVIAAFDYSYLVFAALFGIVLFDDWPSSLTCLGLGMIVLAGLASLWAGRDIAESGVTEDRSVT